MNTKPIARRRTGAGFAVLALLLCAAMPASAEEPARLSAAEGVVEVGVGDPPRFQPVAVGAVLPPGAVLRTGPDSRAEVRRGGDTLRLYADTLLRLEDSDETTRVELERGRSLFDVFKRARGGFEVRTREVAVLVKGTRFLVDAEAGFVTVFRGLVGVEELLRASETIDVHSGLSLSRFEERGGMELHVTPFADPWEAWSGGAAHPLLDRAERGKLRIDAADEVRRALGDRKQRAQRQAPPERSATPKVTRDAKPIQLSDGIDKARPERTALEMEPKALPVRGLDPVLDVPRSLTPGAGKGTPTRNPGPAKASPSGAKPLIEIMGGDEEALAPLLKTLETTPDK